MLTTLHPSCNRRSRSLAPAFGLALALAIGCTTGEPAPIDEPPDELPDEPFERVDLRQTLDQTLLDVVGVTVDPVTSERYVLDRVQGIYALRPEGAVLLMPLDQLPVPDVPVQSDFTDLAALGDGRFALTALNNGYLLDIEANTLEQYFCYLPPAEPQDEVWQLTLSLTYDADGARLLAQPETRMIATDEVLRASIGEFSPETGQDLRWHILPSPDILAGGMTVENGDTMLLGEGGMIYRFDIASYEFTEAVDLTAHGVAEIAGMAYDRSTDSYLLIDGHDLLELPAALLVSGQAP